MKFPPRLFSTPRAYDPGADSLDLQESVYIEIDGGDFGADRFYNQHNGNPSSAHEINGTIPSGKKNRRAQAELRRLKPDFSQLLKHWR